MANTCPRDGGELVEVERSGVRIDACRTCRGVWLDRGELDKLLEAEARHLDARDHDDEAFLREVTGGGGDDHPSRGPSPSSSSPGFDRKTAERIFKEYKSYKHGSHGSYGHKKRKKSLFEELLG